MVKSKWKKTNQPCPCGKKETYAETHDGDGYCFSISCRKYFKNKEETEERFELPDIVLPEGPVEYKYYPHRGLSLRTLEVYNIRTKFIDNQPIETGFHYREENGYKFRRMGDVPDSQRFYTTSGLLSPGVFGKSFFDPGSKESIVICEGMYDGPSVYEITNGRMAGVSVTSSGMALRDVTKDRDYINSFSKIYLCLDNDDPGHKATREIATSGIFDHNKLYIVKYNHFKDPNEYLQHGPEAVQEFLSCIKHSRKYSPDNIISSFGEIENILSEEKEDQIGTYPFKTLNEVTYGIHAGEIVVFKGMEGLGKSEVFRAIESHLLRTSKHNIGIIHLEEDNKTTIKAIAGYHLRLPATLPDCGLTNQDILKAYREAVEDNDARIHIYSSFETEDESIFYDNIRFLATVAGCRIIFLDHITWLGVGLTDDDERKKLDRISQRLKLMAKELQIAIIEISHTNDAGQTRGSRNISKVANTVISLSRDVVSLDPTTKNRTYFLVEKVRLGGKTGPAGFAQFDPSIGILEDGVISMSTLDKF